MANFITGREKGEEFLDQQELLAEGNRIAAEHFEEERMIREPSVVFEFGSLSLQQVFPTEKYYPKVCQALESGRMQLINFWAIENASQQHSLMYMNLARVGYEQVPGTIVALPKVGQLRAGAFTDCPLWVRKKMNDLKTGESYAHRGKGVSFFYPEDLNGAMPKDTGEFTQQFVVPPDGYIRDIRTYVVGNEVIPGYIRKAPYPIDQEQLRVHRPITQGQYVTAEHPGEVLPLKGELAEKAVAQAKKFRDAMIRSLKINRNFLESQPVFGFGSVDFLQNERGDLLACDFDVGPTIREQFGVMRDVAKGLVRHIGDLAHRGGVNRDIYIFADSERSKFVQMLEGMLLQTEDSKKIIFKKTLEHEASLSLRRKQLLGIK